MNPLDLPHVTHTDWPRHATGVYPILVCVQFDETGHNALAMAMRFAELHGHALLQIIHVVPDANFSGSSAVIARHGSELDEATVKLKAKVMVVMAVVSSLLLLLLPVQVKVWEGGEGGEGAGGVGGGGG